MKKLLSGIVAIVVLMALATNVKAASFVGSNEVGVGDTFKITIDIKGESSTVWLKYDPEMVEYAAEPTSPLGDIYPTNDKANGIVKTSGGKVGATNASVTYTFKALKKGDAVFSTQYFDVDGDTEPAAKTVKIVKATEGGNTGNEGQQGGTTQGTTGSKKEEKVNDQGKVINKLPKTGVSYVAVAGLVLAVAGSIVVARKISK